MAWFDMRKEKIAKDKRTKTVILLTSCVYSRLTNNKQCQI